MTRSGRTAPPDATRCGPARRSDRDGWIHLHVEGAPYNRGWQHGWLLAEELRRAIAGIEKLTWLDTATPFAWWAANARAMWARSAGQRRRW
jgi:hypothetical protein